MSLVGSEEEQTEKLLPTLRQIAGKQLRELLVDALDSAREVGRRSYLHPNGFLKVVLISPSTVPFELRLHQWHSGEPSDLSPAPWQKPIHEHGWSFASTILTGALAFQVYEPDDQGAEYVAYLYQRPSSHLEFSLQPRGLERLVVTETGTHYAGSAYCFERGRLHRTWCVGSQPCTSLVLQGRVICRETRVYHSTRMPESSAAGKRRPVALDEAAVRVAIRRVLELREG